MLKCICGSTEIYEDDGYVTIFRCSKCNRVGTEADFSS